MARMKSVSYFVSNEDGEKKQRCKKAFLSFHAISPGRINNIVSKKKTGDVIPLPDQRGRHKIRPNVYSEEEVNHAKAY